MRTTQGDHSGKGVLIDGRFELVRRLGEGGQAVVFAAIDRRLGVERALKMLLPDMAARPKLRARFESEARTMALLDHPNIVRVHDVCTSGRTVYTVMDLVPGGSLKGHLDRGGPLPPDLAVRTTLQICAGVAAAHAAGVVHRDIKPHNVLLARDGTVRIVDFGIARTADGHRTKSNAAMGTLGFVAPEQLQDARSVDGRADVYGIGMTLFVLVTGADPAEWLRAHRHPRLPKALEPIVERATAEKPEERHPTVQALAEALEAVLPKLPAHSAEITFTETAPLEDENDEGPTLEQVAGWFTLADATQVSTRTDAATPIGPARVPGHGSQASQAMPGATPRPVGPRGTPTPVGGRPTPATPRPVGYSMSRPVAARGQGGERPEYLAEDPAKPPPTGFEVKLADEDREATEKAAAKRAGAATGATPAPRDPNLGPRKNEDPAKKVNKTLAWMLDLLGKLPIGIVGPVVAMVSVVFAFVSWQRLAEERAERQRREAAEVELREEVLAQRDTAGVLVSLGADGERLETLFLSYEGAETEPERARIASLIYADLHREAGMLLVDGSASSTRVDAALKELDAALDEYRATHPSDGPLSSGGR